MHAFGRASCFVYICPLETDMSYEHYLVLMAIADGGIVRPQTPTLLRIFAELFGLGFVVFCSPDQYKISVDGRAVLAERWVLFASPQLRQGVLC
jgi:hypothetical protein